MVAVPLPSDIPKKVKNAVLEKRKLLLKTLKKYIDANFNSKWGTILNLEKENHG